MKAIRIDVDGSLHPLGSLSLETLQKSVGGWVQAIESNSGDITFWCNEEGKLEQLPVNTTATLMLYDKNPAFKGHDFLVGPVVITGGVDEDGNTLPISDEGLRMVNDPLFVK